MWEQLSEAGLPQRANATFSEFKFRNSYWLAQGGLTIVPYLCHRFARRMMHDDSAFVNATSGLLIKNPLYPCLCEGAILGRSSTRSTSGALKTSIGTTPHDLRY